MCSTELRSSDLAVHHFKTAEMMKVLGLTVTPGGILWSVKDGQQLQYLSWSAEQAIAYVVGRMLDSRVRAEILQNAVVTDPEVKPEDGRRR